jgi:hypothetical protein
MTDELGKYKGKKITKTSIVVNKLGDGLSKAVDIEPIIIDANDVAYLAVRVRKTKDRYDAIRGDDGKVTGYELVQVFDSIGATFTDGKLVVDHIQSVVDRIAAEEALRKNGQLTLEVPAEPKPGRRAKKDVDQYGDLAQKVDDALKDAS